MVDENHSQTSQNIYLTYALKFKEKIEDIKNKHQLIYSDIITILGSLTTLLGIYVFNFWDVNVPFIGRVTSTLAGSVKFIKQLLGLGKSLSGNSSISAEVSSMIHLVQFFIATMTILPIVIVVCIYVNNKISKIIASSISLITTILFFIFKSKIQYLIESSGDSKELISSVFGPASSVIIAGLLIMLFASLYSLSL